jgi:peroxiredoxin Q/BCP
MTLSVGDAAPDFSLTDDEGTVRTLREFRGHTVVLYFYPRADTPG